MAPAVDNNLPPNVALAAISVRTTVVAPSVVRSAAYYRACRQTTDKAGTISAPATVMMLCICRTSKANDRQRGNRRHAYSLPWSAHIVSFIHCLVLMNSPRE
jgi:hypothetical protein